MRRTLGCVGVVLAAWAVGSAPALANENGEELVCPAAVGAYTLYSGWNLPPATVGDYMWACQYYVYEDGEPAGYALEVRVDWSESPTSDANWACSTAEPSDAMVVSGTRAAVAWWDLADYDGAPPPPESEPAAEELLRQASPLAIACSELTASGDADAPSPSDEQGTVDDVAGTTGSGSSTPPAQSDDGGVPVAPVAGGVLGGLLFLMLWFGYVHKFRTPPAPAAASAPSGDGQPPGVGFSDAVGTLGLLSAVDETAGLSGVGAMGLDDFFERAPADAHARPKHGVDSARDAAPPDR